MTQDNTHMIPKKLDYVLLLLIMALAFYIAFIPHRNYSYPVHIDEWMHLAYSKAIIQAGSTTFIDPFYGELVVGLTSSEFAIGAQFETGFHLFWGIFHQISGIPWLVIFRYFPGIILMMTVLSVYILGRRQGFGWEAAFFTSLIPTTVGILGPVFLVPVAMGLLLIPLSIFVAFNFKSVWSYLTLFIFTSALVSIHAVTALGLFIALIPYILFNLRNDFKHSLGVTLAIVIPCLLPFLLMFDAVFPIVRSLFSPQPPLWYASLPLIIPTYGYLPILFCLLGTFTLVVRGGKKNYGLVLGLLALLLMLVVFFKLHYGIPVLYYRGLMYMMLLTGIIAGAGLAMVWGLTLPSKLITMLKSDWLIKNAGKILCVAIIGLTLAIAIPNHQETPYYHMIDSEDYQAFVWIKDNVSDEYKVAILDPWKATAFVAVTEKNVYTKIHSYPKESDKETYDFLRGGCSDTDFLREKGISVVYTCGKCDNPDLVEVRKNVYLLEEMAR